MPSLIVIIVSFLVAFVASRVMVIAGITDVPVDRSNHRVPTPTAGGVGVLCGLAAGFLSLSFLSSNIGVFTDLPAVLSLCFAMAMVGLYDDLYAPPTSIKFGIFIGMALLLIYVLGPVTTLPFGNEILKLPIVLAVAGTLLWIFVVTNAVNFMDGANGFMPGCMAIAFAGLAALSYKMHAPQTYWMCLISGAAWLGFLPWNFRRKALIFSGDIGAISAGFMYAAAVLLFARETASPMAAYFGALVVLPFITDVLLTLLWRVKYKKNLLMAHRDHLYQRAIRKGVSHAKISLIYYSGFAACLCAALLLSNKNHVLGSVGFAAAIIATALVYFLGLRVWRIRA